MPPFNFPSLCFEDNKNVLYGMIVALRRELVFLVLGDPKGL